MDNVLCKMARERRVLLDDDTKIVRVIKERFINFAHFTYPALRVYLELADEANLEALVRRRLLALSNKGYLRLTEKGWEWT